MRRIIAIAGIVGLGLSWAALPAGAGNNANFVSTPSSGPVGTVIHASDHNFSCDSNGANVHVQLIAPDEEIVATANTTVAEDSTWDVDITVPPSAAPGQYLVTADCSGGGGEFRVFYNDNTFTVTVAAPTTTTTSTTVAAAAATTTTTTVPVVVTPAAPPAAPVVAAPALAG